MYTVAYRINTCFDGNQAYFQPENLTFKATITATYLLTFDAAGAKAKNAILDQTLPAAFSQE